jgi:hypothetical protein
MISARRDPTATLQVIDDRLSRRSRDIHARRADGLEDHSKRPGDDDLLSQFENIRSREALRRREGGNHKGKVLPIS